jgi:hypothetical protein
MDIKVKLADGLARTPHSLRKGATTAAHAIEVKMQKIENFGGWATESSVVLDYIDPIAVPTTADWYFFGWRTPWGGQPQITRQTATCWQTEPPIALIIVILLYYKGFTCTRARLSSLAMTLRMSNRPC